MVVMMAGMVGLRAGVEECQVEEESLEVAWVAAVAHGT